MNPWTSLSKFADPNARWIWSEKEANLFTKSYATTQFIGFVSVASTTSVTFHVIVDNLGEALMDGVSLGKIIAPGWGTPQYSKFKVLLMAGCHIFQVIGRNEYGPAGLLAAVIDDSGKVFLRSDSSWRYTTAIDIKNTFCCPKIGDCLVSGWSYEACSVSCGSGTQRMTRNVTAVATSSGAACPSLTSSQACNPVKVVT